MNYLKPDELLKLLGVARSRSTRDWAMMLLAYRHGLRASEVCGLKLADLDLKAGSICIRRLKGSLYTVQALYRHRGQPLLDETAALRAWLRMRSADGSDYVFTSQKGGKLRSQSVFPGVPERRSSGWLGRRKETPACPEAFISVASGREQCAFGSGPAVLRTNRLVRPCNTWAFQIRKRAKQLKPH